MVCYFLWFWQPFTFENLCGVLPVNGKLGIKYKVKLYLVILLVSSICGCTAYQIPHATIIEANNTNGKNIPLLVVDANDATKFIESSFVKALKSNEAFGKIHLTKDHAESAWIVKLHGKNNSRCFSEPILTVLSLGLIPHIGCVNSGYYFDIYDSKITEIATINTQKEIKIIWGFASWFYLPFESWGSEKALDEYESKVLAYELKKILEKPVYSGHP
jgi:hypothetical protein